MSTSTLTIPTVTEADLLTFHARTFGRPFDSAAFAPSFCYQQEQQAYGIGEGDAGGEEDDDDDGLGYYPDGTKRTLTDAQVEIFRHSEIHQLRMERERERERELEADEAEEGEEQDEKESAEALASVAPDPDAGQAERDRGLPPTAASPVTADPKLEVAGVVEGQEAEDGQAESKDREEEEEKEYALFLEKERKEFAEEAKRQREIERQKEKRRERRGSRDDRTVSTRRKVREMDAVGGGDVVLDY